MVAIKAAKLGEIHFHESVERSEYQGRPPYLAALPISVNSCCRSIAVKFFEIIFPVPVRVMQNSSLQYASLSLHNHAGVNLLMRGLSAALLEELVDIVFVPPAMLDLPAEKKVATPDSKCAIAMLFTQTLFDFVPQLRSDPFVSVYNKYPVVRSK